MQPHHSFVCVCPNPGTQSVLFRLLESPSATAFFANKNAGKISIGHSITIDRRNAFLPLERAFRIQRQLNGIRGHPVTGFQWLSTKRYPVVTDLRSAI